MISIKLKLILFVALASGSVAAQQCTGGRCGFLAARPAACTPGDEYIAIDASPIVYRCAQTPINTWLGIPNLDATQSLTLPSGGKYYGDGSQLTNLPGGTGTGTVTSVVLTAPSWFAVGGSPITSSGTLAVTAATGQTAHQVIGTCGAATSFSPCSLVAGDLPLVPRANGGLNSSSAGTGILRDGTTPTAAELSGDATTSGSNVVTVVSIGGKTVTLGGTLTTTGAFNSTFAIPSSSTWTFPSGGGSLALLGSTMTGIWNGTIIGSTYGGTGVNNGSSTLTMAGNVAFTGSFNPTFAIPATGTWTFPAAGTLAALTGTAHGIKISEGTTSPEVSIACGAGQMLQGAASADPTCTATPALGASGTLGSLTFGNATSGLLTIQAVTGALGAVTVSVPAATDTLVNLASVQTLSSKTFVAPALGTPASGVATNLTGLPLSTGITGFGTGVATFLGTPTSANLAAALTDETGTGAAVFANTPTLVTPVIGAATGTSLAVTGALSAGGGVSSTADGVHAGDLSLVGNTTAPSLASNTVNDIGPNVATFTAYGLQRPSIAPSANTVALFGTASLGITPVTYGPLTSAYIDSSIATTASVANQVTAASAATAAKQVCTASGASKTCTYIDFPEHMVIPAANCIAGTAGAGWSNATSNFTAACRAGTNNLGGALQAIPSTGASGQFIIELPADWDTATQPYINIFYGSGANTSGTVIWTVSSSCSKADGSVTDDTTFTAESAFASQTMATANRMWGKSGQFTAITSGNSCIPGGTVIMKMAVSGTAGSVINAYQAVVTIPPLQATGAQ